MTAPVQRSTVEGVLANHEKRVGILEATPPSNRPASISSYAPVGGFQTITSTNNAAPDTVLTSSTFVADGVTQYRVDFGVAVVDIGVTKGGTGTALVLTLTLDTTILGLVCDYNITPKLGEYGSIPVYLSVFDTPSAGSHTYTIGAFKSFSGGATALMRIYGDNAGPPFVGVTHPGYLVVTALG